ncbi:MAG: AAA family ATPase [bacterium]|nr:AAA family ATPase [bacterium]
MGNENIKGIPYGVSDYGWIVRKNKYYVDKTGYLPKLEELGEYLFFIRPRRFGKSLFISMMHYYYDVKYKDRFDELFKGTWLYENPTKERNQYLVLSLNFSEIAPASAHLESSFSGLIRDTAMSFIADYKDILSASETLDYYSGSIKESGSPADILRNLSRLV